MKKLRILYSFPLRIGKVGIGMTAWHQVCELVKSGVDIDLNVASCERRIAGLTGLNETLVFGGLKVPIRVVGRSLACEFHDRVVARRLRHLHDQGVIDLVHCWPSGALETLRIARELGIRTLLERPNANTKYAMRVVDEECKKLAFKLPKSHSHAFNKRRLYRESREFELADRLLCPSLFVAETFLDAGFSRDRISLHQYGYDPSRFSPSEGRGADRDQPFTMAFIGSGEPRKGLHYALDAWLASKACENGTFYICGEFLPGYERILREKLRHPSIKQMGFTKDIESFLRRCDTLTLPSIEEGSALVTYEARACGCVLMVSNAAGAKCKHMVEGLVHKVGDVEALRGHMDMLATDRGLLRRLRKNSLAGVAELTWKTSGKVLLKAYDECMDNRTSRGHFRISEV